MGLDGGASARSQGLGGVAMATAEYVPVRAARTDPLDLPADGGGARLSAPAPASRHGGAGSPPGRTNRPGRRWLDPDPAARSGAETAGPLTGKAHAARIINLIILDARQRRGDAGRGAGGGHVGGTSAQGDPGPAATTPLGPSHSTALLTRDRAPRDCGRISPLLLLTPPLASPPPRPCSHARVRLPARPPPAAAVRLRSARATAEQRRASVPPLWSTRPQPAGRPS
jgi:hypothetical protein